MSVINVEQIKAALVKIANGDNLLDMLCEFERTLDQTEIYAYQNWMNGEVVDGPHVSRYWMKLTLMYQANEMPDPRAGLRLEKIGCKVYMRKGIYRKPVRVFGPDDIADQKTRKAKIDDVQVWLIDIEMPIKYVDGSISDISGEINDSISKDVE